MARAGGGGDFCGAVKSGLRRRGEYFLIAGMLLEGNWLSWVTVQNMIL